MFTDTTTHRHSHRIRFKCYDQQQHQLLSFVYLYSCTDTSNSHLVHYDLSISKMNCIWRAGGGANKVYQSELGFIGEKKKKTLNLLIVEPNQT